MSLTVLFSCDGCREISRSVRTFGTTNRVRLRNLNPAWRSVANGRGGSYDYCPTCVQERKPRKARK